MRHVTLHVTSLNLFACRQLTDQGLVTLASLTSLTSLNLGRCQVTDDGLHALAGLTALRILT